jgi:hypothetical protein
MRSTMQVRRRRTPSTATTSKARAAQAALSPPLSLRNKLAPPLPSDVPKNYPWSICQNFAGRYPQGALANAGPFQPVLELLGTPPTEKAKRRRPAGAGLLGRAVRSDLRVSGCLRARSSSRLRNSRRSFRAEPLARRLCGSGAPPRCVPRRFRRPFARSW